MQKCALSATTDASLGEKEWVEWGRCLAAFQVAWKMVLAVIRIFRLRWQKSAGGYEGLHVFVFFIWLFTLGIPKITKKGCRKGYVPHANQVPSPVPNELRSLMPKLWPRVQPTSWPKLG